MLSEMRSYLYVCTQVDSSHFHLSIIKCPLALLINITITSGEKYGQGKAKCPPISVSPIGKR